MTGPLDEGSPVEGSGESGLGPVPGGRRRIDRVLLERDPSSLPTMVLDQLRDLRAEAAAEEADLSYLRRIVQGRIDIVRAEQSRRAPGSSDGPLVEHLATILADARHDDRGLGRFVTATPPTADQQRRGLERVLGDVGLSDVAGLSDAQLVEALDRLSAYEREVSDIRARVQHAADSATAELARRYREGTARVEDLLAPGDGPDGR
ncbi:MAG: RsiG family protein [Actinomycetes bacterium]